MWPAQIRYINVRENNAESTVGVTWLGSNQTGVVQLRQLSHYRDNRGANIQQQFSRYRRRAFMRAVLEFKICEEISTDFYTIEFRHVEVKYGLYST